MLSHLSDHRHSIQGEIHTCQLAYMTPIFFSSFLATSAVYGAPPGRDGIRIAAETYATVVRTTDP